MGRAAIIILIFFLAGPLIGLATLTVLLSLVAQLRLPAEEAGNAAAFGAFIAMYGIIFAHFLGGLWAALAGALVALRTNLWGPASIYEGVPIGVFTAIASIAFWDLNEAQPDGLKQMEAQAAAGWALVHIIPTMACIWLTQRWQTKD
jgi:hypothetical protein